MLTKTGGKEGGLREVLTTGAPVAGWQILAVFVPVETLAGGDTLVNVPVRGLDHQVPHPGLAPHPSGPDHSAPAGAHEVSTTSTTSNDTFSSSSLTDISLLVVRL